MERSKPKNTSLLWLCRTLRRDLWRVGILAVIQMAQGAAGVLFALALGNVVDAASSGSREGFVRQLLLLCGLVASTITLRALYRHMDELTKARMDTTLRGRVFSGLIRRSYAAVTAVHTGEWLNRLTSDVSVVVAAATQILPGLSGMAVRLIGALVLLVAMIPQAVYVLLPAGIVQILFSLVFRNKLKNFHRRTQQADGRVRSFMQERLANLLVVRAFAEEETTDRLVGERMNELVATRMQRMRFVNLCFTALHTAMQAAHVFGIALCSYGILQGNMTYGTMSAILHLISQAEAPFTQISGYLPQYYGMIASAERLQEMEDLPADSTEPPLPSDETRRYYQQDFAALELEGVHFSYIADENETVLHDLSLTVRKGDYVAFIGESGCGKSTAMKLLLALYPPDSGNLWLQNKNGKKTPLTAAWRSLFAYVPQGNGLFSGTIREAIAMADPIRMQDEKAIRRALEIACANGFVDSLPQGLDTELGEQGTGLSEGQAQRLAIARAVLSDRPILLLDEATSALDGQTEERLLQNLRTMTDRTVLLITHRPAALEICDRRIEFRK